ncbi:MAG: lysylphosphatidylglycerol synthase domain-containing protein [Desulfobacterales bacterium]|nr:lysylphosphatidylglycerol synthase domain-containing protein [Desulfobacterales bacterium]
MKFFFKLFIYISLVYLIFHLYQNNYLIIPEVQSFVLLVFSIFFMLIGFLLNAKAWQCLLKASNKEVTYSESISSIGLSIFGKYMPGKFWVIVGRAAYVAEKKGDSIFRITTISFLGQGIAITTGIILGNIVLWYYMISWFWVLFFIEILFLIFILCPFSKLLPEKSYFYKKGGSIILLLGPHLFRAIPWFLLFWISWGIGFYGFVGALSITNTWIVAPIFILSSTLGILAFFVPGGIGVREGFLSFFLIKCGYSLEIATTIAVGSRLWFLLGEIFVFICGLIISNVQGFSKKNKKSYSEN